MNSLGRLDWNLIPALEALLQERNVSRAARRMGVSQSAASGALARLRRHFDDDLLTRSGNGYELTPVGQRLLPLAHAAVDSAQTVLTSLRTFDPATSTREFRVATTEYAQILLGSLLTQRVTTAAPGARLTFCWPGDTSVAPSSWLAGIDGWFGPRDSLPGLPFTGLHPDRWVCVVDRSNPRVGQSLALEEVVRHSWVVPTRPRDHDRTWKQRLFAHGLELRIALSTESFSAVPFLVAGTELVGIVQHAIAARLQEACDIRVLECPWPMAPLNLTFWWHPNREHDAAHLWLREQVAATMSHPSIADQAREV